MGLFKVKDDIFCADPCSCFCRSGFLMDWFLMQVATSGSQHVERRQIALVKHWLHTDLPHDAPMHRVEDQHTLL